VNNKKYDLALESLLKGSVKESLQHVRSLRDAEKIQEDLILEQKLMTFRLAIKAGNGKSLNEADLHGDSAKSHFLRAEAWFIKGLILTHKEKLEDASSAFLRASEFYVQESHHEKSLLSRFNSLIALANTGRLTPQDEINLCGEILQAAREHQIQKIQALALRQRSYAYFASGRFLASLQEIKEAMALFEIHGPVSDFHLSLVHAADCSIECKEAPQARMYLDYLPAQIDARVEFPRAYVLAKLHGTCLDESIHPDVNPHWKARYSHYIATANSCAPSSQKTYFWNLKNHRIFGEDKKILAKIKPNSLEGKLLKILAKGPHGKDLLCEILWPDFSVNQNLDERFFRLKSRLQQKIGAALVFDGESYLLSVKIQLC